MIGLYVVVNGVPSVGVKVMVGTGQVEDQPIAEVEALPVSSTVTESADSNPNTSAAVHVTPMMSMVTLLLAVASWFIYP
jgi:hypothetical protein